MTDTEALLLALLVLPWAVLALIALLRGYNVAAWRDDGATWMLRRHRHDRRIGDDDDG